MLGGEGRFRADFTPQRLEFGYLRYQTVISGTILESTVSVNRQTDGRLDQNRPFDVLQTELSVVTATGLEVMATKTAGEHILTAGMEVYDERVDASRTFSLDGFTNPVRPRFPDDSRYTSLGLFLLDELSVGRLNISGGARYSRFRYKADASKNIINGIVVVPSSTETFDDITMKPRYHVVDRGPGNRVRPRCPWLPRALHIRPQRARPHRRRLRDLTRQRDNAWLTNRQLLGT